MFIDLDTQLLPDSITLPLALIGLWPSIRRTFADLSSRSSGWSATSRCGRFIGVQAGATGKEGMGYGDFKLLAALGAWLAGRCCRLIILSSVVGAIVGIADRRVRRGR